MVEVAANSLEALEKWRGKYKVKPPGRPKRTANWRLKQLLEPSLRYIEDIANGKVKVPNGTRIVLAWKIVERYGEGVKVGEGKKERESSLESQLKE